MQATLQALKEAVVQGKQQVTVELSGQLLAAGVSPRTILDDGLIAGMALVGDLFKQGRYFVPEMLVAARAMKSALALLRPQLVSEDVKPVGTIILGTVRGDLHDIGKNLTSMFLEGAGFRVIDLGVDVTADKFVHAVRENKAEILAMSALLTTTMGYTREVLKALEAANLRSSVKVIVGGAPMNAEFAAKIGADAFAPDAASGAERCRQLIRH